MIEPTAPHTDFLHLFEGFGVELEYMIVDRDSLDVRPMADRVLEAAAGELTGDVERGPLAWSNELVLHVIELKTNGPAARMAGLAGLFQDDVRAINRLLEPWNACLMPSAAHPWMDPYTETRLWPHDNAEIYDTFNRIFDCRGHGWSNLQSAHLNLPFADDDEFVRLHAAVRLVLPLIPGIAAASPFLGGQATGLLDSRLEAYRRNCERIFSVTGHVIPEPVESMAEYHDRILQRIYDDLAPHDPEGVLRFEWANARGAIARFDRRTIEIRVVDVQECPVADLAVLGAIASVICGFTQVDRNLRGRINALSSDRLLQSLLKTMRDGESAMIDDTDYLACLGLPGPAAAASIWATLIARFGGPSGAEAEALDRILTHGTLATRMRRVTGPVSPESLRATARALCLCLENGHMLMP
jgi:glutamate---cysteine ligase / carboxylate-amine ligase